MAYNPEFEEFLLLKRAEGRERFSDFWEFSSGFVEENESVKDAALRELQEEKGLTGEIIRTGESFDIEGAELVLHPVLVKVSEDEVKVSREHSKYNWVEKDRLEEFQTVPRLGKDLQKLGID